MVLKERLHTRSSGLHEKRNRRTKKEGLRPSLPDFADVPQHALELSFVQLLKHVDDFLLERFFTTRVLDCSLFRDNWSVLHRFLFLSRCYWLGIQTKRNYFDRCSGGCDTEKNPDHSSSSSNTSENRTPCILPIISTLPSLPRAKGLPASG